MYVYIDTCKQWYTDQKKKKKKYQGEIYRVEDRCGNVKLFNFIILKSRHLENDLISPCFAIILSSISHFIDVVHFREEIS